MPRSASSPTRRQRAAKLARLLADGPLLSPEFAPGPKTPEGTNDYYLGCVRRWLDSWIIPEVIRLVPELAKPKPEPESK